MKLDELGNQIDSRRAPYNIDNPIDALSILNNKVTTGKSSFENLVFGRALGLNKVINILEGDQYKTARSAYREAIHDTKNTIGRRPRDMNSLINKQESVPHNHVEMVVSGLKTLMQAEAAAMTNDIIGKYINSEADSLDIDIGESIKNCTLKIILNFTFGDSFRFSEEQLLEISDAANTIVDGFTRKFGAKLFPSPIFIPLPNNSAIKNSIAVFDRYIDKCLQNYRSDGLLGHLMHIKDSNLTEDYETTRKFLRDQAIVVLLAGHETVAANLPFIFNELHARPDVKKDIEASGFDDDLIKGLIWENLRFHPPVASFYRVLNQDVILESGIKLLKGRVVKFDINSFTQNESLFTDAGTLDHRRYLRTNKNPSNFWDSLIFARGNHSCIGSDFAIIESQIIIKTLLTNFKELNINYDFVGNDGLVNGITTKQIAPKIRLSRG